MDYYAEKKVRLQYDRSGNGTDCYEDSGRFSGFRLGGVVFYKRVMLKEKRMDEVSK